MLTAMEYQITYCGDLSTIDLQDLSTKKIAEHFARRGYDFLYLFNGDKFFDVITFSDFLAHKKNAENKIYIQSLEKFHCKADIDRFFRAHHEIERLVLLKNDELFCEINPQIELPLQNNVAKNLMSLRYVKFFRKELIEFLAPYKKIIVIAEEDTALFIKKLFPDLSIEFSNSPYKLSAGEAIFDFLYGKKILSLLNGNIKVCEFNHLVEQIALQKLIEYCRTKNVMMKFFRLPMYGDLTCLHPWELENFLYRTSLQQLSNNTSYLRKFCVTDADWDFMRGRTYNEPLRLDDGFCFIQDDCHNKYLDVQDGIRSSIPDHRADFIAHFYGPCTTFGFLVPDDETVPSYFNRLAKEAGVNVCAQNHGGLHGDNGLNSMMCALNTPVRAGDAFIFLDVLRDFPTNFYPKLLELGSYFNVRKRNTSVQFFDFPGHCNLLANKIMAEFVFGNLFCDFNGKYSDEPRTTYFSEQQIQPINISELSFTHAATVKTLRIVMPKKFTRATYPKIGAIVIPINATLEENINFVKAVLRYCDALYIFQPNIILNDEDSLINGYTLQKRFNGLDNVKIFSLDKAFCSERYFYSPSSPDKSLFVEKLFCKNLLLNLEITNRFFSKIPVAFRRRFFEIYTEHGIATHEIL